MGVQINSKDFVAYLKKTALHISDSKEYISALDAATGDGDHWINMNMGFQALTAKAGRLETLPLSDCFKEIGMTFMSVVGGSSGVLYGGAYLAAAKTMGGQATADMTKLCEILTAMAEDMIRRGKSQPGYKTMIDAIYPAAVAFRTGLENGSDERTLLSAVKQAALDGAESTKEMEAARGRASYQKNKGVGHLDPGAVTMAYQIADLCDYVRESCTE